MSGVLLIGDLHVKAFLLPYIEKAIKKTGPDQVIIMGDYLDDWGVSSTVNTEAAQKILAWARRQGNVTLLFGNHDLAYYSGSGGCSGNDFTISGKVHRLFEDNLDILRAAQSSGDWLFTHAGLCASWAQQNLQEPASPLETAAQINELLESREGLQQLESCGRRRGGWQRPSPLWADWSELAADYYPGFNQIVGHSPQKTCKKNAMETGELLWCCDTFSTDSKGRPYGDGSMLLLDSDADTISIIAQTDRPGLDAAYQKYYEDVHSWGE